MATTTDKPARAKATPDALLAALADHPEATAAHLAELTKVGQSTATKALATLAKAGKVIRTDGGREDGKRQPDTWRLADSNKDGSARLRPGGLREQVLAFMHEHPGEAFTPHAVAKALDGRSAGAVNNALVTLADKGEVTRTSDKPRRFTFQPAPAE